MAFFHKMQTHWQHYITFDSRTQCDERRLKKYHLIQIFQPITRPAFPTPLSSLMNLLLPLPLPPLLLIQPPSPHPNRLRTGILLLRRDHASHAQQRDMHFLSKLRVQ